MASHRRLEGSFCAGGLTGVTFTLSLGDLRSASAASRAAQIYFQRPRIFGAQARLVLLINAADRLQVPVEELSTDRSKVIHEKSGAVLMYAEIAAFAVVPDTLPENRIMQSSNDLSAAAMAG